MSKSSNSPQSDQETSVFTLVKVGKSYKSKGWALPRRDISKIIPVEKYEGDCHIEIDGIVAPAIFRVNPRLFYRSNVLSKHLEKLNKSEPNSKVALEIKLNEKQLYSNFISKYLTSNPIEFLNTDLPVGKSYKSKGWRINMDITSKFIPLNEYSGIYDIVVDHIPSSAILDVQTRIFYKSEQLTAHLKELHDSNPKQRVNAKIIFDEDLVLFDLKTDVSEDGNNQKQTILVNNSKEDKVKSKGDENIKTTNDDKCSFCGNKLPKRLNKNLKELSNEYPNACKKCLEKIYSLGMFYKFQEKTLVKSINKEHMKNKLDLEDFDYTWDLLLKYEMIEPLASNFRLCGNIEIENEFKHLFEKDSETSELGYNPSVIAMESKKTAESPKLGYNPKVIEMDTKKKAKVKKCRKCGNELTEEEDGKCNDCVQKELAYDYIKPLLPLFSHAARISKKDLPTDEYPEHKKNIIFSKLVEYDIVKDNLDETYSLNLKYLVDFVKKYGSKRDYYIFDSLNNDLNILFLPNFVIKDEKYLDLYLDWDNFKDYVVIRDSFSLIRITLKDNKKFISTESSNDPFLAKLIAVKHLNELNVVNILSEKDTKKFGISK